MRIHFVLTQDLESPSGLGRYLPLARKLTKMGHQVTISALHSNFSKLKTKKKIVDGVLVNYVARMHVKKRGNNKAYYAPIQLLVISVIATIRLTQSVLSTPADILHLGKPQPLNSIAGLIGKRIKRNTLFLDVDDIESEIGNFSRGWQRKIISFFEGWVPFQVDFITTNTFYNKNRLIRAGVPKNKITYIPNGIDLEKFTIPSPKRIDQKKAELKLPKEKTIAYIGTLGVKSHPVHLLLEAFRRIQEKDPNTILLLVGGGEDFGSLQELALELNIQDNTIFTGKVDAADVPLYYALADVSVDPVYDDPAARGRCPIKIFESWAAGTPLVTSDVGDRKKLLGSPPAGKFASPGDPKSLASSIQTVLENPQFANSLGQLGKERLEIYNWDLLAKMLESVYKGSLPTT